MAQFREILIRSVRIGLVAGKNVFNSASPAGARNFTSPGAAQVHSFVSTLSAEAGT